MNTEQKEWEKLSTADFGSLLTCQTVLNRGMRIEQKQLGKTETEE